MKQAESRFYLQRAVLEIVSCGCAQSFEVLAWSPFSCAEAGWGSYQWMRHGTKLQCRETARPVECFELQRLLLKQQRFASILVIMDSATARSSPDPEALEHPLLRTSNLMLKSSLLTKSSSSMVKLGSLISTVLALALWMWTWSSKRFFRENCLWVSPKNLP